MSIVTCELHKVRRSPDFEALKLGKGPSVRVFTVIPTTSFEILEAAGRVVLSSKVLFTLIPANREAFSFSFFGKFRPGLWISGFFFFSLLFYVFCYAIPNKLSLGSFLSLPSRSGTDRSRKNEGEQTEMMFLSGLSSQRRLWWIKQPWSRIGAMMVFPCFGKERERGRNIPPADWLSFKKR